jgi:uncharacterized membrane protein YkoI
MMRILLSAILAAFLLAAAPSGAAAQGACYSDAQIRTAIQAGQAKPLSSLLTAIRARFAGGQVVSSRLCPNGARLAYYVSVLVGGRVQEVRLDAATGAFQ